MPKPQLKIGFVTFMVVGLSLIWMWNKACGGESDGTRSQIKAESAQSQAITEPSADAPLTTQIKTISDFAHSEFCKEYRCRESSHSPLQNGDVNHSYETTLAHVSVEAQTSAAASDPDVTGIGLVFYERERLSGDDFIIISNLARSTDQAANHDKAISFIRANVENAVCSTCQVDQSAKSIRDGEFRIWAGRSGSQVVAFKRATTEKEAKYLQLEKISDAELLKRANNLLPTAVVSHISPENEAEAAMYLGEFARRQPNSNNPQEKRLGERLASARQARDQVYLDARIDTKRTRDEAQAMCRVTIKENLKARSSADFQRYELDDIKYMGNGVFRIHTRADAVNSFGAKLRSTFDCEVQCDTERQCGVTGVNEM